MLRSRFNSNMFENIFSVITVFYYIGTPQKVIESNEAV